MENAMPCHGYKVALNIIEIIFQHLKVQSQSCFIYSFVIWTFKSSFEAAMTSMLKPNKFYLSKKFMGRMPCYNFGVAKNYSSCCD